MSAYEVGNSYLVPCVRGRYQGIDGDWPVIGPAHEDAEHLNFAYWHYHVDVRFVPAPMFQRLAAEEPLYGEHFARVFPLMCHHGMPLFFTRGYFPAPVLRRRRCARQWQYYDMTAVAPWMQTLEHAYRDARLVRGRCPHRAADLRSLPVDETGCVECPLHGLVWHVASGRMVPRAQWAAARAGRGVLPETAA